MKGIFELLFEVTTNLTLIELLDYDHPLLKRAQRETNGTFNHSIVVGNLAEACANAIGAHSLLCRVGAYYHDIGKMAKSEYFIENQYGGDNSLELTDARNLLGNLDYFGTYIGEYISDLQLIYERTGLQDATVKRPTTATLTSHVYGEVRKILTLQKGGMYRISYAQ